MILNPTNNYAAYGALIQTVDEWTELVDRIRKRKISGLF